uniref:Uncharacterized protein n=1 Tax=Meloidogyne floridensis TaxID=298350 RepID=A0A915P0S1_9BILA
MGSVPGSLFGHQQKTTVQPICIDQNSGQIRKLGEDQPIAIRRRLNSALESKTSRDEENVNIFNKLMENQTEDKLNFDSSICSEQTTTIFGRHKEKEFNNISSYNLNSKEEKNNCGDDINDDVEILIDIKNEENEISSSALTDTFYIEKREPNPVIK